MFEIPNDILNFFFHEIKTKGRYNVYFENKMAFITPSEEQLYYKPTIVIKNTQELEIALLHFSNTLNNFYKDKNIVKNYHDLSFFFNTLFMNMTNSDAEDFITYIYKRIEFLENNQFADFEEPTLILEKDNVKYYAKRVIESPGLESPYVMLFYMEYKDTYYNLPLVRYAFDKDGICNIFAVQFGRSRLESFNLEYKNIVNRVNTKINKYRNVSPSFVLSLSLFNNLLREIGTTKIVVPDYLFGRYRKYYGAGTVTKSDQILERILNNYMRLFNRMELQDENFSIECYPLDCDSYLHINLTRKREKNN